MVILTVGVGQDVGLFTQWVIPYWLEGEMNHVVNWIGGSWHIDDLAHLHIKMPWRLFPPLYHALRIGLAPRIQLKQIGVYQTLLKCHPGKVNQRLMHPTLITP